VKFEVGSVAVGQLFFLSLKPPILTVIPLTFHTHSFVPSCAEEEDKRAKHGDIKTRAIFFRNLESVKTEA
jgi:hypothetical protein